MRGMLVLIACAALISVAGATSESWAHPNAPGTLIDDTVPNPTSGNPTGGGNPAAHAVLTKIENGTEATFTYISHKERDYEWGVGENDDGTNRIFIPRTPITWPPPDGADHIELVVSNMVVGNTYNFAIRDGAFIDIFTHEFMPAGGAGDTVYYTPEIEISETAPDRVGFTLTFDRAGLHMATVRPVGGTIDLDKTVTFNSTGPLATAEGMITGLEDGQEYDLVATSADSFGSRDITERFTAELTEDPPDQPNRPPFFEPERTRFGPDDSNLMSNYDQCTVQASNDTHPIVCNLRARERITIALTANDPDNIPAQGGTGGSNLLVYRVDSNPLGARADSARAWVRLTPQSQHEGNTYILTMRVHDSQDPRLEDAINITINVLPPEDRQPTANDDVVISNGEATLVIDVLANDVQGLRLGIDSVQVPEDLTGLGTITHNGTHVTYEPANADALVDGRETRTFTYTAISQSLTDTATVTILYLPNLEAADDEATSNGIDTVVIDVTANDALVGALIDDLTLTRLSGPSGLDVTTAANTHVIYRPSLQDRLLPNGTTVTYTYTLALNVTGATPGATSIETVTANVTITFEFGPLEAVDDIAETAQNTPVEIDVLANDAYTGDSLPTLAIVSAPGNGMAVLSGSTITYTPDTDYAGTDTFVYNITDADDNSDEATVTVEIGVPPVAADDTATSNGVDTLYIDATANDTPANAFIVFLDPGLLYTNFTNFGAITHNDTHIIYEPSPADALIPDGTQITIQYILGSPGLPDQSTADVTITFESDTAPGIPTIDAVDDDTETTPNTAVDIDVLDNDIYDTDGPPVIPQVTTQPEHGTVELTGDAGILRYTPETDYTGEDSFVYEILDFVSGDSDTATVTIEVSAVTPVATATPMPYFDQGRGAYLLNINVTSNIDGTLYHRLLRADNSLFSTFTQRTVSVGDNWLARSFTSLQPNTMYFYEFSRSSDYTRADVLRGSFTTGSVPIGAPDVTLTIQEDSDASTIEPAISGDSVNITSITTPTLGTATHNTTTITYDPNENQHGTDTITYTVTDGSGATETGTITVTITPVNDAPVLAAPAIGPVSEMVEFVTTLEATDIDNSTAELTFGVQNAPDGLAVSGDRLTWNATEAQGSQTFTFTITVTDGIKTDSQEVTVTVTETNQDPMLFDFVRSVGFLDTIVVGTPFNTAFFTVSDADLPAQSLSPEISSNATGTRPTIMADPIDSGVYNVLWTPSVAEIVSITATVTDDWTPAGTASVTLTVIVHPSPPIAPDETATTLEDTAVTITPDIMDDGTFTITAVTNGTRGTATTNGTAITYTPNENANGADMITYTVQDDDGATVTGRTTITITPVNDAPALEPIDDITVDEGEPVEIRPAATDVDNDDATLTFSLSGDRLPAAATFDETNGALDWNTTETDGGTLYDIAITASDGQLDSDPEAITITVTETNQDPVLDNIGDITVQVDTEGTFTATATDADIPEQTLTYSIADAPAGATIDGQTGVFRWTPDTLESRTVNVTVSDGQGGSDSQNVTITVSDQPPPEAPDESRTVQEDSTDNFITPAIMDDGTFTITAVTNGTRGTATTNGTAITYTPNANVNGTDTITYTVTDDDDATDTGTITITIAPVNDAPALEPIDDITVDEGEPVEIRPAAADVDNDDATLTFSLSGDGLPAAATFDETNGYLDWTTAESDGGTSYMINITVSDGDGGSDSEVIAITVTETNQNPVFDSTIITEQSATLGEPFALDVTAADADVPAQTVSYEISSHNSTGTPPAIDPATGTITWTPNTVQTVSITVRASDSFMTAGTTDIEITVTVAPPANTAPAARDFSVEAFPSETASVNLTEAGHISDAEQDASTLTVILNTTFGTHGTAFTDDDTFVYFASSGSTGVDVFQYTVEDDGGLTDTAVITVTVTEPGTTEPNQAPEFDDIVTEHEAVLGEQFTLEVTATDADVPAQTITYAIESQNATGTPPAIDQATGMITWMPDTIETVLITVRASDNFTTPGMTDINLTVTVSAPPANTAPTTRDFAVEVATSETISVNLTEAGHISDAEQDTSTLTVSLNTNVGTHGTASINGDTFAYNATSGGTGVDTFEYTVEDDGGLTASATITVTVTEPNQNPVFDSTIITNRGAAIGEQITLAVTATDPDGPAQTITYQIVSHDATGAEPAIDQNTGTITWTPDTAETVSITVRASDDQTPAGTADITINVRVDEIVAIADRATTNGIDTLHIHATANDAPSDARIVNVNLGVLGFIQNLGTITHNDTHITYEPSEADRFRLDGSFIPPFQYTLQSQDGALRVQALVYITFEHLEAVDDAASTESNMPVVIDVLANDIHRDFTVVTATDPENGSVEVSAADGVITYTPDTDYAGQDTFDYTIRDTSSDSTDTATVTIEVVGNAAPMLDTIPSHNFAEGVNGTLDVTAQDPTRPDGDLMWSLQGEPAGMTITSTGPTTAQIQWMPTEAQGDGTPIRINVTVTDSEFTDSQAVTVRALEVNQDPVLDNIGPMSVQVDDEITFTASAIDGDIPAQTLTYSIANAPTGATMTSDGMFSWTPGAADINAHTFTVTVSDGEGSDSQEVTITVTDQPPPTASDESRTISEDSEAITITPDIMDDGTANITAITVQPTLGTATHNETTITYTPNADAHGNDTITYTVTDDDGASNPGTITITITSVNDPPVFDSAIVTNQSAAVGEQFTLDVTATDVDLPAQTITYEIASHDATGTAPTIDTTTGTISWTPDTAEIVSIIVRALDDQTPADTANITITVTVSQTPTEPTLRAPDIDVEAVPSLLASARPDIGAGATITSATGATMGTITEGFLSQGTIAYTAAANASGIDEVTYTVSDGADGTAQGTIYFYINAQGNERPVLDAIPGIQTDGTSIFQAMATDDDDDTLTYVIRNAPEGATINSTAGAFSWNATDSNPGDYIFNVVVHDDSGGLALQKMVVTVRDPNNGSPTAPVVHRSTTLGTSVLIAPDIRDPEGQPTGMILAVGAEKGTIREGFLEANIIAYVPTEEGTDIISYTTSDGAGGATTSTVYVHTGTSEDPDLEAIGVQRVNTTEILEFQTPISDEDSSDISYVMSGAPDGATLDESTGGFSWTPAASDVGDHAFTITAYDGQGGFDTEHVAISVSDPNVTNHDPDISDLDFAARQNNPRFIALQTSDPDGDPTDIILATNTTAGAILQDSLRFGIVAYVPDIDRVGTDTVTYVISDGRGGASTGTIYVHIRDPNNDEPTLESVGIKQVGVPNELTFNVTATDNDEGDVLTFGIRNAPAGATINSTTGAFSWTPTASDMGDHAFTVVVRDDAGGFATERIIITVTDPTSPNQPPTASDESDTTAGERIVVFVDVTDPDGDDLTIIAATGATQGLVDEDLFDDTIIAYTPLEGAFGTETITYTVSDGHGGLATGTITITIG